MYTMAVSFAKLTGNLLLLQKFTNWLRSPPLNPRKIKFISFENIIRNALK